MKKKIYCGSV